MSMPAQKQHHQPGSERKMRPQPDYEPKYPGVGKLKDKVALITGGDSGIGRAVAVAMAREGAKIAIVYLEEHKDANETVELVKREGSKCLLLPGDVGDETFCEAAVEATIEEFGRLDILVNNAAEQHETDDIRNIQAEQIERTFRTNIFSFFYMAKHALGRMGKGGTIINTASITAYQGHKTLLDYSATKGAIVTFTRSLAEALVDEGIRVNAVAPGPVETAMAKAVHTPDIRADYHDAIPLNRYGLEEELAEAVFFLCSDRASYITGQILAVDGGFDAAGIGLPTLRGQRRNG
jgi:NAD(P)-dependent dehydrogenase (short-subunit alcohol dehydrogenase family)